MGVIRGSRVVLVRGGGGGGAESLIAYLQLLACITGVSLLYLNGTEVCRISWYTLGCTNPYGYSQHTHTHTPASNKAPTHYLYFPPQYNQKRDPPPRFLSAAGRNIHIQ